MLAGCGPEEKPEQVELNPFAGVELTVAVPASVNLKERWQPVLEDWATATRDRASSMASRSTIANTCRMLSGPTPRFT